MRIGELSSRTGVSPRLLRYYEEKELLSSDRTDNGYRRYSAYAPKQVARIRALLSAGLSTDVIRAVLPCASGDSAELDLCPMVLATLRDELSEVDKKIASLSHTRDWLVGLVGAQPARS
ncbi:MAG: MerR family transcriptional regulator [Kutzneria sp.]|nr:MerR family transcriptional regulator [Kutzneria sp.]MBV9846381.1 MerR family transcriptional regulator [Kutzneria sp.]